VEPDRASQAPLPERRCADCRLSLRVFFDGPLGTIFHCPQCHDVVMVPAADRHAQSEPHRDRSTGRWPSYVPGWPAVTSSYGPAQDKTSTAV